MCAARPNTKAASIVNLKFNGIFLYPAARLSSGERSQNGLDRRFSITQSPYYK